MTIEESVAALELEVADLRRENTNFKADIEDLRTSQENLSSKFGYYAPSAGDRKYTIMIHRLYSNGTVDGVVFGDVSGGSFFVDSVPMKGKQAHGQACWEPLCIPRIVQELQKLLEAEKKAEEAATTRANNPTRKIATPTRP